MRSRYEMGQEYARRQFDPLADQVRALAAQRPYRPIEFVLPTKHAAEMGVRPREAADMSYCGIPVVVDQLDVPAVRFRAN